MDEEYICDIEIVVFTAGNAQSHQKSQPSSIVANGGIVAVSSTGTKTGAFSTVAVSAGYYLLAVRTDGAALVAERLAGMRWAFMGSFMTYHLAGGPGGMRPGGPGGPGGGPGGPGFRPPFADASVSLVTLQEQLVKQSRTTLWLLLGGDWTLAVLNAPPAVVELAGHYLPLLAVAARRSQPRSMATSAWTKARASSSPASLSTF